MRNPVAEYVHASRELPPIHPYIADHVDSSTSKRETIAGRSVMVTDALTEDDKYSSRMPSERPILR